jgi:hypothetical protein
MAILGFLDGQAPGSLDPAQMRMQPFAILSPEDIEPLQRTFMQTVAGAFTRV